MTHSTYPRTDLLHNIIHCMRYLGICTTKANRLPTNRIWDCVVDLLPGAKPPQSRVYSLSLDETKAMEDYVVEALTQGFIRQSTCLCLHPLGYFCGEERQQTQSDYWLSWAQCIHSKVSTPTSVRPVCD